MALIGRGCPCPFDGHAKPRRLFRLRIDMGITSQRCGVRLHIGMGNAESRPYPLLEQRQAAHRHGGMGTWRQGPVFTLGKETRKRVRLCC